MYYGSNRRQMTIRDTPSLALVVAIGFAVWPWLSPPQEQVVDRGALQSLIGTVDRVYQTAPYSVYHSGRHGGGYTYFPGYVHVVVDVNGGINDFKQDVGIVSSAPGLLDLQKGNDVIVLVEPRTSDLDRLWQLKSGTTTVLSYEETRSYVVRVYGHPAFWDRLIALVLLVAAFALRRQFGTWSQPRDAIDGTPIDDDLVQDALSPASGGSHDNLSSAQTQPPAHAAAPAQIGSRHSQDSYPYPVGKPAIPAALAAAAHAPEHAGALLLALLLDDDLAVRDDQETHIRDHLGEQALADTKALAVQVARLHPTLQLPLAELAFPQLRRRPRPELTALIACVDAMVRADNKISLFEYCLGCMLHRQLAQSLDPSTNWQAGRKKPFDLQKEIAMLLSVIAQNGQDSEVDAQRAFAAGMHSVLPGCAIAYAPPLGGARALDSVWSALDGLDDFGKSLLVEGVVATIGMDGEVTVAETQLLHIVCAMLHCQLPQMADPA